MHPLNPGWTDGLTQWALKTNFLPFTIDLPDPIHFQDEMLRQIETEKEKTKNVEFLIVHRYWPEKELEEGLTEIAKKKKITSAIGIEPLNGGGMTDAFKMGDTILHILVDPDGIIQFQTRDVKKALEKIGELVKN